MREYLMTRINWFDTSFKNKEDEMRYFPQSSLDSKFNTRPLYKRQSRDQIMSNAGGLVYHQKVGLK